MQPLVLATGEAGIEYNPHRLGMTDHALTKKWCCLFYWYLDRATDSVQSTASNSPNVCDHEMPLVLAGNPNSNRGNKLVLTTTQAAWSGPLKSGQVGQGTLAHFG